MPSTAERPVALVTGVGRRAGIGASVAERLAQDGWDVGFTYWTPYDVRMEWTDVDADARAAIGASLARHGAAWTATEADLALPDTPAEIFATVRRDLGRPVTALVMLHCESVDSSIMDTSLESWDRHFAVNARATWLLIREYARQHAATFGDGRIIAFTSDHTVHNLPYGASKGALDRITITAATELKELGITANVINPGPVDTGWMSDDVRAACLADSALGRLGLPSDAANLVAFLCSPEGGWINGQLLHSNGGFHIG